MTEEEKKPDTVPLTPEERATLTGLIAARQGVNDQIEGYMSTRIAARLGVHRNRIVNCDIGTGLITMASDAPKAVEAPKE